MCSMFLKSYIQQTSVSTKKHMWNKGYAVIGWWKYYDQKLVGTCVFPLGVMGQYPQIQGLWQLYGMELPRVHELAVQ